MQTIPVEEAVAKIEDGARLLIGGSMGVGPPTSRPPTVIANDTAMPAIGIGKLRGVKLVKKLASSHIGLNPETKRQMMDGSLRVDLVPH